MKAIRKIILGMMDKNLDSIDKTDRILWSLIWSMIVLFGLGTWLFLVLLILGGF
jgi:hypothetical protein